MSCAFFEIPLRLRLALFVRVILSVVEIQAKRGSNEQSEVWDLGRKVRLTSFAQDDTKNEFTKAILVK
jgi:hypothetical protein